MSQSLILPMMEQGQIFDTSKMREWLTTQRSLMPTPKLSLTTPFSLVK